MLQNTLFQAQQNLIVETLWNMHTYLEQTLKDEKHIAIEDLHIIKDKVNDAEARIEILEQELKKYGESN